MVDGEKRPGSAPSQTESRRSGRTGNPGRALRTDARHQSPIRRVGRKGAYGRSVRGDVARTKVGDDVVVGVLGRNAPDAQKRECADLSAAALARDQRPLGRSRGWRITRVGAY